MSTYQDEIRKLKIWIKEEFEGCIISNSEILNNDNRYELTVQTESDVYYLEVGLEALDRYSNLRMAWEGAFHIMKRNAGKVVIQKTGSPHIK